MDGYYDRWPAETDNRLVNGQKVGESGEQTICPLARIGISHRSMFSADAIEGKIRNLKVWDRVLTAKEIGRAAGLDIPDNLAAHCGDGVRLRHGPRLHSRKDHRRGPEHTLVVRLDRGPEQWVAIDLRKPVEFNTVTVAWETARPRNCEFKSPKGKTSGRMYAILM